MKTKIKRHSRSVISVLLSVCMLISCMTVGLIATDAANVTDSETVGGNNNTITDYFFKGSFDGWTKHYVNGEGKAYIDISKAGTYDFVLITGGGSQRRANHTFTSSGSYNTAQDQSNFKIRVTTPGTYTFKTSTMNSGGSVTVTLTFPSGGSTTNDWKLLDGNTWDPNTSTKKFTLNSSTGLYEYAQYFSTGNNYFRVSNGSTVYCGSASGNTDITAGGSAINLVQYNGGEKSFHFTPESAGTYIVQVDAANSTIRIQQATQYTVTCTTSGSGTLESSPAQAYEGNSVTLTATPDAGYTLKSLKLTYNGTDYDVTNKVSNNKYTFSMPAYNVTAAAVFDNSKTIYFNNYVTKWPKIFVYTENASGDAGNGIKPGQEMTRLGESSIYQIEIPADSTKIIFTGSGGTHNEGGAITCGSNTTFGNAVPTGTYDLYKATNTSSGTSSTGEWSQFQGRSNIYTVTPGTSVTGDNTLYYKGLSATLYDYYTDGEYKNGWITGIAPYQSGQRNAEYCVDDGKKFKWNPYKTLDKALSVYARSNTITYPLYFGNLNIRDQGNGKSEGNLAYEGGASSNQLYHFYEKINNSVYLTPDGASVTGLAANSESDSTIYHSSGDEMVMFDEDWLSRENETGNPLATILHSTGFPVRKVTAPAGTVYPNKIYVDAKGFDPGNGELWAHFFDGTEHDYLMTKVGSYYECEMPSDSNKVLFVRQPSSNGSGINWSGKWNESNQLGVPTSSTDRSRLYTFSNASDANGSFSKGDINTSYGTYHAAYDYYKYDSTGGLDNAYIQNVNTGTNTATIEYSNSTKVWSANAGNGKSEGFFPFDNMTGSITNQNTGSSNVAHDLGFGMKLEIPFSINANGTIDSTTTGFPQTFNFSGDDDLWVYIDGKLVLDLGGAHKKAEGSIDFKSKTATSTTKVAAASALTTNSSYYNATETYTNSFDWFDNTNPDVKHTMTLYYMERGMYESNLKFDFSFHAIRNLYTTEKKVRTSEVNSGFYEKNATTNYGTSGITKFERSYQDENFTFDHKVAPYSETQSGTYSYPASSFTYSKEEVTWATTGKTTANTQQTYTAGAGNALNYALNNDEMTHFIGKFTSGDYFRLQETPDTANNYYYTPRLTVYNDNDSTGRTTYDVTEVGEGAYTFEFSDPVATGLETVNVRGRFENEMKTHDLTIRKSIGDNVDATTEFTFYIAFDVDIENTPTGYIPYPLFCTSDDAANGTQINASGQFKLHGGEYITFHGIPEGIRFRIYEDISGITDYTYGSMSVIGGSSTAYESGNYHGVDMTMGTNDVDITTINNDNHVKATIRVKYARSYYDFEQGTNISQDTYTNTSGSYTNTAVVTQCQTSFTDGSNTSTTEISADKMVETDTRNASESFAVSVDKVNAGGKLFIGWYDEDGNRYNDDDATQHSTTASAAKDEDRIFEARFIDQPTYRIDYAVPTRLWGNRIYKVFGKVTNDMISNTAIGYDSSREYDSSKESDRKYYITGSMVEANKPTEDIFLKNITWDSIDTSSENGKTTTEYKVGKKVTHNSSGDAESVTETGTVTYDLYRSTQATAADKKVTVDLYYDFENINTLTEKVTCDYGSSVKNHTIEAIHIPDNKTFHRWKIETLNSLGGTTDGTLVTYDYSKNFNYVAYDNYKVTAEFLDKINGQEYNPYSASNSDDPYHDQAPTNVTSVINLGQTRSHWNDTTTGDSYVPGEGESTSNKNANYNYDRLFIDLALSYSDRSETKLNTVENLKVGFIIQYKNSSNQWINWKTVEFSSTLLGDKNRIEYYYGFNNIPGNRSAQFRVQPTIGGVESGTPIEFNYSADKFSTQT